MVRGQNPGGPNFSHRTILSTPHLSLPSELIFVARSIPVQMNVSKEGQPSPTPLPEILNTYAFFVNVRFIVLEIWPYKCNMLITFCYCCCFLLPLLCFWYFWKNKVNVLYVCKKEIILFSASTCTPGSCCPEIQLLWGHHSWQPIIFRITVTSEEVPDAWVVFYTYGQMAWLFSTCSGTIQ